MVTTSSSSESPTAGSDAPVPGVWLLYAIEGQSAAKWVKDLRAGQLFFWRHNGTAYTKQLTVGDSVVVLIGNVDASGRSTGGRIVATGLLASDANSRFTDTRKQARRWLVLCVETLPDHPIDRKLVESTAGPLVRHGGSVHTVSSPALNVINSHLRLTLPIQNDLANQQFKSSESIDAALSRSPHIQPAAANASSLRWPPVAERNWNIVPTESEPSAGEFEGTQGDIQFDDPPESTGTDAYIPFRDDAPSQSEDTLDRGQLALFLARRLHLIWCEMNDLAPKQGEPADAAPTSPGAVGKVAPASSAERETFIVHIDAPWGGGKTTFANFVARALDPRGDRLNERHFLRFVAPADASPAELGEIELDEVFFLPPDENRERRDRERERWHEKARKPWIVVRYDAWRDQYVQPPWWHVFQLILAGIRDAVREMPFGVRRAWCLTKTWWIKFAYLLFNSRVRVQLISFGLIFVAIAAAWASGLVKASLTVDSEQTKTTINNAVAILATGGVAIAAFVSIIGQSFAPDLEFTAEHKQIGVRDPIGRFRRTFGRILKCVDRPILLIVDNLDRCEPRIVVEILRGFQTIIRSPRLFVLVLGDRAWIEKAHEIQHKDFTGITLGTESTLGERFVAKIFQLSFTLPAMTREIRTSYAQAVLSHRAAAARRPDTAAKSGVPVGRAAVGALTPEQKKAVREVEKTFKDVTSKKASVADYEQGIQEARKTIAKLAADAGLSPKVIDALASKTLVAATSADSGYQHEVANVLFGLAASLPNNPRQIKRIINSFALYETVGRLYFDYLMSNPMSGEGDVGDRSRRWRQLAMWTTLATEWPQTWRELARDPRYVEAAYREVETERARIRTEILGGLDKEDRDRAERLLRRLTDDVALSRLLCVKDDGQKAGPSATENPFAGVRIDAQAIYQFNRIMWEPGFPTM